MLNNLFLLIGIVSSIGIGGISSNIESCNECNQDVAFHQDNKKYASYNDNDFEITLTANELNSYTWTNFNNYFVSLGPSFDGSLVASLKYNEIDGYVESSENIDYFELHLEFDIDEYNYYYISFINSVWSIQYNNVDITFEYGLYFEFGSTIYDDVKSAIEQDIVDNINGFNNGIFETLTDSVVAFVSSLGSGILAIEGVFYDSVEGHLTVIGLLSVIVVAVSLAYFLFRLIIGFIRMRG